jgi:hypothetical protein
MAKSGARARRGPLLASVLLVAAAASQGCFSMRPWRACRQPCVGPQLERARQVRVYTRAQMMFVLTHAAAGKDQHGAFLAGDGSTAKGTSLGKVRVYTDEICAVRTQRLEGGRVVANAVAVPIVVAGVALAVYYGADVDIFDGWDVAPEAPPEDPWPEECREAPAAAASR